MKTKEIKEALKKSENGMDKQKEVEENLKIASDEINEICKKRNVRLISIQQDFYGQQVWVPTVVPNK